MAERGENPLRTRRVRPRLVAFVAVASVGLALPGTAHAGPAGTKFVTPSGNIWCLLSTGADGTDATNGVVCEIREHHYAPPPKPADCHLNWGDRISLKRGGAPVVHCHGDTIFEPGVPTLPYGQARSAGSIKCESQPSGVTCTDSDSGQFFRLSRQTLELG
ncbi:DUF6636 domain-containing protein [Mycolicibacterium neworleansense]|uniref:Protein LppI n=1 Tax=Mycolicibacterium neworleansense TaxID=146018 RepID=A0A0H5RWB6_9MYCO|nr:DUF6636 domain-containing protein [Mycolicibacterium neworleansense]MCV7361261.1 hypothetical protein [Mycolicibacterium neworleansense]CRZ18410.1 protein LppI [Mycolicibacterium neworleansense]